MDQQKLSFITTAYVPLLKEHLKNNMPANWGKMNAQQMVEHVTGFFYVSTGKLHFDLVTPEEHLPKFKEFLLSDKEFRENTKAPLTVIGEEALPLRHPDMNTAIAELQKSIDAFIFTFKDDQEKKTLHPVFGELNFEEWVLLHYKHVKHHLKQFGLV
jgi:oxepin-CoA hydrolase/3-oxo-5,6-dehydrosuberyl-CoA semialdehyde dehydrogenase